MDLTDYLSSKAIRWWQAAGPEITVHCFLGCPSDKAKGKLYLNTETWAFQCKRCGAAGGRKHLMEHFGDRDDAAYLPGADPAARMAALLAYTMAAEQLLGDHEDKIEYLLERGLTAETIMEARLGYVPKGFGLVTDLLNYESLSRKDFEAAGLLSGGKDFHSGRICIPYLHRGSVVQIRGKEIEGRYFTPAGDKVRLFNADDLAGAEHVLLVEGEFDTLITRQALRGNPHCRNRHTAVVGLPGAGAWPGGHDYFPSYFREAKRVYIGLDPDTTGVREAEKLKEAIGSKARIVMLPSQADQPKCDWTEFLRPANDDTPWGGHTATDIDDLIAEAEQTGRRIFSVVDAAMRWRKDRDEKPGIKLGFPSLDALIEPGLRPGNVMVPLARTGTGKTVFLANIAWNTRDRRVLHITLENTISEMYELLRRIYRFWNPDSDEFSVPDAMPRLRIVDENRLTAEDIDLLIAEYTQEVGEAPELVMLDYLGYFARSCRGSSSYEKTSAAIMDIKAVAKRNDVAIITPHQVSRVAQAGQHFEGHEARDSGVVEETADFLLGLVRPGDAAEKVRLLKPGAVTAELQLQLLKSRRGGRGRIVDLAASPVSLVVSDAVNRVACGRIEQELVAYNRGLTYDQIVPAASNQLRFA